MFLKTSGEAIARLPPPWLRACWKLNRARVSSDACVCDKHKVQVAWKIWD